jgi:hypothetical protein
MPTDTTTAPAPWERQADESDRAFAAFVVYRDLGGRRSLDEVCRRLYPRSQTGRKRAATGRVQLWSTRHRWVARARAWDAERDRLSRQAAAAAAGPHPRQAEEGEPEPPGPAAAIGEAERALGPWLDPGQSLADGIRHLRHRIAESQVAVHEAVAKDRQRVVRLLRGWGHTIGARDSLERAVLEGRDPGPSG